MRALGRTPSTSGTPAVRSARATRRARAGVRWKRFTSTPSPGRARASRAISRAASAATLPLTLMTGWRADASQRAAVRSADRALRVVRSPRK